MNRITRLLEFLKESPNDSFVLFALALEYQKEGDLPQALTCFNTILEKDPNYTGLYYHLGKLYEKLSNHAQAVETYKKGIALTKASDPHACRELQQALMEIDEEE